MTGPGEPGVKEGAHASGACGASQSNTGRGRGARLAQWASDLRLGVRLAIGGGRTSKTGIARLVLGTIGVGLAVAVLLVGASAGPMFGARDARELAQVPDDRPVAGVDPLLMRWWSTQFRDRDIQGSYVRATGPNVPLPPGLSRLPAAGEIMVSPALAELLAAPEGELLRPRFPQRVVGTIDRSGVTDAKTLVFYAGEDTIDQPGDQAAYGFGHWTPPDRVPAELIVLLAVGTVVLLVPVFVFITTSARIAGAERDRRLAALRLVGADGRQAKRIAAAESLVSVITGLVLGVGLFLLFRSAIGDITIFGVTPYPSDVSPPWPLVVVIVLLVPVLAVMTAMVALRRTIIEPLGVMRRATPVRRTLWWRVVPVVAGPVLLLSQVGATSRDEGTWVVVVVAGATLLLIGIPALLPWLLERAVARLRGGRPAIQLAIRRLQSDSGTPARVVSGVAVVLAGAIALQAVLAAQSIPYAPVPSMQSNMLGMRADDTVADAATGAVRAAPGVRDVVLTRQAALRIDGHVNYVAVIIADCETLRRRANVPRCADGDVFATDQTPGELRPGSTVTMVGWSSGGERTGGTWTLPARFGRPVDLGDVLERFGRGDLLVTPGALDGVEVPDMTAQVGVWVDRNQPDVAEHARNALVPFGSRADIYPSGWMHRTAEQETFVTIRRGLLGGALFILLLAGVSMLVLALEQIRERRRPLAALAATGVPTGTLGRSLLWQCAVPVLLALLVAVATGIALGALVLRLIDRDFAMDWPSVGVFSAAAAVLTLLVTVVTLPALRSATRLNALRTE